MDFRVGDISLVLTGVDDDRPAPSPESLFFGRAATMPVDIEVEAEWVGKISLSPPRAHFTSGGLWNLFREQSTLQFDLCSPVFGVHPYKRLITNPSFTRCRLLLSLDSLGAHRPILPLAYPVDELLITNYLAAHGLGVEVHGCGLVDAKSGGHLLLGHSGAGKSTTARLWQSYRNPEILSDDRIILRIENGELWMYGTPWHGEARFASPGKAKLNHILILQHGERNQMTEMPRALAAGELFARCFPPFHSPEGLQNVVDFLDKVVNLVPCYKFHFVPNESAVDAVLEMQCESLIA